MRVSNYFMIAGLGSGLLLKGATRLTAVGGQAAMIGSDLSKTALVLGKASDVAMWGMTVDFYMKEPLRKSLSS